MEIKADVDLHLDLRSKGPAANSQQDLIDLHSQLMAHLDSRRPLLFFLWAESKQKENSFKKKGRVCIASLIASPSSTCSDNSSTLPRQPGGKRGLECYLNRSVSTGHLRATRKKLYLSVDLESLYIIFGSSQFLNQLSYLKLI